MRTASLPAFQELCHDIHARLRIVIIYEDHNAGCRAIGQLSALLSTLDPPADYVPELWPIGLLGEEEWRELAAADLKHADMVIVSNTHLGLSPQVERWLKTCLEETRAGTAMVYLQPDDGGLHSQARHDLMILRAMARQAHLDFFTTRSEPSKACVPTEPIVAQSHWGLNE